MFGKKKTVDDPAAELHPAREGAKNRPTPKRRDQEAARKQPLVELDRKKARDRDKDARRVQYAQQREALRTGDDRHLPPRDKGPARRFVRDWVDARRSMGEFLLPLMLVIFSLNLIRTSWAPVIGLALSWLVIGFWVIDTWLMWRGLKRALVLKFGSVEKGLLGYSIMRSLQMRRTRMPKPMVGRGEFPS